MLLGMVALEFISYNLILVSFDKYAFDYVFSMNFNFKQNPQVL